MTAPTLSSLTRSELSQRLAAGTLKLRVGPYCYALRCPLPGVAAGIGRLYGDFSLVSPAGFVDFPVALQPSGLLQRLRRQLTFSFDELPPFGAVPRSQAYAFLEWGMNWCLSVSMHEYLKLHAAVVAKDGLTVVMPGLPGAGKSTLCAALGLRGWRVLSDEHALICPSSSQVVPVNRPVSLKNASIDIIRDFEPGAVLGPVSDDTHKGRVAHLKADLAPDSHDPRPLSPAFLVFPRYRAGASLSLHPRCKSESFLFAAHHSFNYSVLAEAGFEAMSRYIDRVECLDLEYSRLDEAIEALGKLVAGRPG